MINRALLLIAHGSRLGQANKDLDELAKLLRTANEFSIVEPCYLELAAPDIAAGAKRCIHQGAECIIMLPYFLSAGVHVRRDLQAARQGLIGDYPGVKVILAEPIGLHPAMVEVMLDRAREAELGQESTRDISWGRAT